MQQYLGQHKGLPVTSAMFAISNLSLLHVCIPSLDVLAEPNQHMVI